MYRRNGLWPIALFAFLEVGSDALRAVWSFTHGKSGRSVQDDELKRGDFAPRIFINAGVTTRKSFRFGARSGDPVIHGYAGTGRVIGSLSQ